MPAHRFLLNKWYLDVLDSSGRGMIGYQADLTWGKVSLRYDGVIPIGEPGFKSTGNFSSKAVVSQAGEILTWNAGTSTGTWQRRSPSVDHDLLDTAEGSVRWHCLQPTSEVMVNVGAIAYKGLGYAERMELTLPPWRLPIRQLLWGRYVSKAHSIVWIRWHGEVPRVVLYLDGRSVPGADITSTGVSFDAYRIDLPTLVVRKGTLGESLFAGAAKLAALFPKSILALQEEKWYGMATLKENNRLVDEGNVIHETVHWP